MDKLISMTDFVLDQYQNRWSPDVYQIVNYAKFLKQKLELWMFVPCKLVDGVWVVLEEPKHYDKYDDKGDVVSNVEYAVSYQVYKEAKERGLFEDVEYAEAKHESSYSIVRIYRSLSTINYPKFWKGSVVEDLIKYDLTLTESAKKQIGL